MLTDLSLAQQLSRESFSKKRLSSEIASLFQMMPTRRRSLTLRFLSRLQADVRLASLYKRLHHHPPPVSSAVSAAIILICDGC